MFGATGDDVLVGDHARVDYYQDGFVRRVESLFPGVGGDDYILGEADDDVIIAGDGSDTAEGNDGHDIVHGDHAWVEHTGGAFTSTGTMNAGVGGADSLSGNAGDDVLFGSAGSDSLFGDTGDDLLIGDYGQFTHDAVDGWQFTSALNEHTDNAVGPHDDQLFGHDGKDVLVGGLDSDTLEGNSGDDILLGDRGTWVLDDLHRTAGTLNPSIGAADEIHGHDGSDMAFGGFGADTIGGDDGDDFLLGDFGEAKSFALGGVVFVRTITPGQGGEDEITGDSGKDFLFGGFDQDSLEGGTENDILVGDYAELVGDPTGDAYLETTSMADGEVEAGLEDVLLGGDHNDALIGGFSADVLQGHTGHDIIIGDQGRLDWNGGSIVRAGTTDPAAGASETLEGGTGDDVLLAGAGGDELRGETGDDILFGDFGFIEFASSAPVRLETNDEEFGGDDVLFGATGEDTGIGGMGDDLIHGDEGDDLLMGDYAFVLRAAGLEDDVISPNSGTGGDDTILGHVGEDREYGGPQGDHMWGNADNDTMFGQWGPDVMFGDQGEATSPKGLQWLVNAPAAGDGEDYLEGNDGSDVIFGGGASDVALGGSSDDFLIGDTADAIFGDFGEVMRDDRRIVTADTTNTSGASDTLSGDEGADLILGGAAGDLINGGFGFDAILGDHGHIYRSLASGLPEDVYTTDPLEGGDDTLGGDSGEDTIMGGTGADAIHGGTGADIVLGDFGEVEDLDTTALRGAGADWSEEITMTDAGLGGEDTVEGDSGPDSLFGGAASDTLYGGTNGGTALNDHDVIFGDYGEVRRDVLGDVVYTTTLIGAGASDWVQGSEGNDFIFGGDDADTLYGGSDDDVILGDFGVIDVIAGARNRIETTDFTFGVGDSIFGDGGNDIVMAGDGADTLFGGADHDILVGDHGTADYVDGALDSVISTSRYLEYNDLIHGGEGDDEVLAGEGDDEVWGDEGSDVLFGDHGLLTFRENFLLRGESHSPLIGGDDVIHGSEGGDYAAGQMGDDSVFGEAGDDVLYGDSAYFSFYNDRIPKHVSEHTPRLGGSDLLEGGEGDDVMAGGWLDDVLRGDEGEDVVFGDHFQGFYKEDGKRDEIYSTSPDLGGNDDIEGGDDNDILLGGAGADYVKGEGGDDILFGEHGRIRYVDGVFDSVEEMPANGDGPDTLVGGDGDDTFYGDGWDTTHEDDEPGGAPAGGGPWGVGGVNKPGVGVFGGAGNPGNGGVVNGGGNGAGGGGGAGGNGGGNAGGNQGVGGGAQGNQGGAQGGANPAGGAGPIAPFLGGSPEEVSMGSRYDDAVGRWVELEESDEEFRIELSNEVTEDAQSFSHSLLEEIAGEGLLGLVTPTVAPKRDDE